MDFLSELNRSQQYVQYLLDKAEMEELDAFNGYILLTKDKWLSLDLPEELKLRIEAIGLLQIDIKRLKHSWWGLISFGGHVSEELAKDELKGQLRVIRGQLASIDFLYRELLG
jgi:hypothetical protein